MTAAIKHIAGLYARVHRKLLRIADTVSPTSVARRVNRPPLFVFSLHKSGTHLLRNILESLGFGLYSTDGSRPDMSHALLANPSQYISTVHRLPGDDVRVACAKGEARIILNIRDPRDIFLSTIDYFDWTRPDTAFAHVNFYRQAYSRAFPSRRSLALAILEDRTLGDYPYTISAQLQACQVLYFHPSVLSVKYEDFMACLESTCNPASHPVSRICEYLQIDVPKDIGELVRRAVTRGSRTMNVGRADRWRVDLDPDLIGRFQERHGQVIRSLGYSID